MGVSKQLPFQPNTKTHRTSFIYHFTTLKKVMKRSIIAASLASSSNHPKYFTRDHKWIQQVDTSVDSKLKSTLNSSDEGVVVKIGITKERSRYLPEHIVYIGTEVIQDMAARREQVSANEPILEMDCLVASEIRPVDPIRSPVSGVVLSLNQKLNNEEILEDYWKSEGTKKFGSVLKTDPERDGFICELELSCEQEIEKLLNNRTLITENDYQKLLAKNELNKVKSEN